MNTQKPVLLRELAIKHLTNGKTNKEIFDILVRKVQNHSKMDTRVQKFW